MNQSLPSLLTIHEVAVQLKVSDKTVRRWIKDGDLHSHLLGHQYRVSEDDLAAFVASRRR